MYKQFDRMNTAALFDLDGVIVDTEPCYTEFWTKIGEDFLPDNQNFASVIKGQTLTYILTHFFSENIEKQSEVMRRLAEHQQTMEYPYVPGVMDFIDRLREMDVGVAVVTSSDKEKMSNLYKYHPNFKQKFNRIFTAEDALRSKPAPDCYISAARFFGLEANQCVVFEDSFNGLQSGRASGAKVVGLTTSNSESAIMDLCDVVVPDFRHADELLDLFKVLSIRGSN